MILDLLLGTPVVAASFSSNESKRAQADDKVDYIFHNATVITMSGAIAGRHGVKTKCKIGTEAMNDIGLRKNHSVVVGHDGKILMVAPTEEVEEKCLVFCEM